MKKTIIQGQSTYDGAGVKLTRIFANDSVKLTDPFLLLDHFGSDNPDDYLKGFPWHPHRGIETVTYMLSGVVKHGDSIGNSGSITPGDIQWMTAGAGVLHQEMPQLTKGMLQGLQLWVNLPKKKKMIPPRYRGIVKNEVPIVKIPGGEVRVIAGAYKNVIGPVKELIVDVEYLDVRLNKGRDFSHANKKGYTSFCYLIKGAGRIDEQEFDQGQLVLFNQAGAISVQANTDLHYIFVTGKQLKEPIAWGGPIVMNTQSELDLAFEELSAGTFIKTKK